MPAPTPSRPDADRNLLFGILAVQMDFVSREAPLEGMNGHGHDPISLRSPLDESKEGSVRRAAGAAETPPGWPRLRCPRKPYPAAT